MNPYEQPPDSTTDQPPIAMDCGRHFIPASGLQVDLTCQECRFRAPGTALEEPEGEFWCDWRLRCIGIINLRQCIAEFPTVDFDSEGEELIRRDDVLALLKADADQKPLSDNDDAYGLRCLECGHALTKDDPPETDKCKGCYEDYER
jgi:hypothetical protein